MTIAMTLPLLDIGLTSYATNAMFVLIKNKQKLHVDDSSSVHCYLLNDLFEPY
jgi:hypothetical protein